MLLYGALVEFHNVSSMELNGIYFNNKKHLRGFIAWIPFIIVLFIHKRQKFDEIELYLLNKWVCITLLLVQQ